MGYSTDFKGILEFRQPLTKFEKSVLEEYLGEDCRDHPEWNMKDYTYIDLQISKDETGLEWDGAEKTYDFVEKINFVITEMKKMFPSFGLTGYFEAFGEERDDQWILLIENDIAKRIEKINLDYTDELLLAIYQEGVKDELNNIERKKSLAFTAYITGRTLAKKDLSNLDKSDILTLIKRVNGK